MSGWVRLENTMPDNLKLVGVSDRAFRLWVHAVCYCSRGQTDGMVPESLMGRLTVSANLKAVEELLKVGLIERVEGGFFMHDYLEYNPSKERIGELRAAGRKRTAKWRNPAGDDVVTRHPAGAQSHVTLARASGPTPLRGTTGTQGEVDARASRRADPDQLPGDFPAHLAATVGHVLEVLLRVQRERGGELPTVRGVALAVGRYPDRDHVFVAGELEHWSTAGSGRNRAVRDWPRQYGAFLKQAPAGSPSRPAVDERQERRERDRKALGRLMGPTVAPA